MAIEPDRLPPPLPRPLLQRAARWADLKRWERRDLGRALRMLGLSYKEIASIVPVSKGTLSGWCRDIELTASQIGRLAALRPDTARVIEVAAGRKRDAIERKEAARKAGRIEATGLLQNPLWIAGVVAYWSEGAKREHRLKFSNSDARLVRLFMRWATTFLEVDRTRFAIALHLHSDQGEAERRGYWAAQTGLPLEQFRATFVKQAGTGHRKNDLYNGTASVVVLKSGILLPRVLGWIDAVAASYGPLAQLARASDS